MTPGSAAWTAMRRGRWLSFVILLSCVVLIQSSTTAETPSSQSPDGALILYDSASPYAWAGELHALEIANLLGHFPLEWTIAPVESYLPGEVEDYAVTFYLGDVFYNPLPEAFLSDVMTTERTVCWFKYNLWQIAWDEDLYWDPEFTSRYGFQFAGVDISGFPEIVYKGVSLVKDTSDPDLGATVILDPGRAEVKAVAYRPGASPPTEDSWPYVVHAGNLWYFADTPFSYVSEEDRYLVFCDLLHDIVGIDHAPSRRALIRIEDVDPTYDPRDLIDVADYLHSQGVPFQVAVIPVFKDPFGVNSRGEPVEVRLSDSPEVVSALQYMMEQGGQLILHGYTHQYDEIPNPYNGMTGDDCEFFRTTWDEETGETQFLGPVPEDSVAWVNDRIDQALAEMALCGLPVVAWETPHYLASAIDSVEFGSRFSLVAGRVIYFSSLGPYIAGQFYPYLIETDIYGQRLLPENLGNVSPVPFYDYPARLPADIVAAAEKNLVVRDAWASSYFHPYLHIRYLKQVIEDTKALGYVYCTIPPLLAEAGPNRLILAGGSAVLEGSASDGEPPYTYFWSPMTGLDDPTAPWPTASPDSTTTYTLTVTDDLGQTAADLVTVTVVPAVVAEAGPDKVIASGGAATLEGSASGGLPPYEYSWSPTTGLDDATADWPIASPEGTTTYTLTVIDDLGQTDTDTVTVTVAGPVLAEAGPDKVTASGGAATLEGSASGGLPPYEYSWSPTTGLDDPTAAWPTASPVSTTTYTLTVIDDLGQTDTDTVMVTVVGPVLAEAGPDKVIVSGGAATLEGSASGGLPPYEYSWSPTTGLDDPTAVWPTASPDSTTTYTLTVIDDLGQNDTDTVTVTVVGPVLAEAGPDKMIASGGAATLEGSASGGLPPYDYSWSPTTGLDDPAAAYPTASPDSTTTYTLTVTDDLGQIAADLVTVTVVPAVVAEAGSDKVIASGGAVMLEGSASGGLPPYEYSWSPTTGLDDPTAACPTASPEGTTVYTLMVTDDFGQTDTDTVTVTVAPAVAAEAGPDKVIASGGTATLEGSASGGLAPYEYSWSPTTGLDDATAAWPSASPDSTTTYALTVTDKLGQTDTDTVTVTVVLASPVVAEAGPDKVVAPGGATTLEGSASGGVPPYEYVWSPNASVNGATAAHAVASPTSTTTYTLTVTDDVGQTDTDTVTVSMLSDLFADVPQGYWAGDEIAACMNSGIVRGYDDGQYHGDWPVDRAQIAVYIARAEGWVDIDDDMSTAPELFPDVPAGHWAGSAIQACVDHGIVGGYPYPDPDVPEATIYLYEPSSTVTRDQMAVYMSRSMADPVGEEGLANYFPTSPRDFPDVPSTGYGKDGTEPFWAYKHIEYCVEYGVVEGYDDGYYHPDWAVTRAQMAVYIARAFELHP